MKCFWDPDYIVSLDLEKVILKFYLHDLSFFISGLDRNEKLYFMKTKIQLAWVYNLMKLFFKTFSLIKYSLDVACVKSKKFLIFKK